MGIGARAYRGNSLRIARRGVAGSPARVKLAIVTTIRRRDGAFENWLRYHRAIGFDRFYVFCDEPLGGPLVVPPGEPKTPAPDVMLFQCDADHWRRFAGHPLARQLDAERRRGTPEWRLTDYVMLRQTMNAELALFHARQDQIAWLLHIDGDELFYPGGATAHDHFAALAAQGVEQARYLNREAVVPGDEAGDFFTAMTLFKANPKTLSPDQWAAVARHMGEKPYFLAYANGKSAMRVSADALPSGVHGFRKRDGTRQNRVFAEPAILHYPYSGYARFRAKHESPDSQSLTAVLDAGWRPPSLFTTTKLPAIPEEPDALRPLYERWVVLGDGAARAALIGAGVIAEVMRAAAVLRGR
jgi:Glycosyl transferase family 2